ncbi:MAG: 50S ribosomal protein L36 [Patescibacteria group bacterium]|mgnify:CR=1 FL=1
MKVSPAIKPRCEKCQRIKRRGINRIICPTKRHKQRQG